MKKYFAVLGLLSLFLLSAVFIGATNQPSEQEEPYDEDTYGPEAPIIWSSPQKSVSFSHKEHTLAADLSCDDCHDELFEMEAGAAEQNDDFNHASMDEGNYCGACHDDGMAFTTESYCGQCHLSPEGVIVWTKPLKAVTFTHDSHSEDMGIDCESCHNELFLMKAGAAQENEDFNHASMDEGNYCGACHDGSTAFTYETRCTTCHIGVRGYARLTGQGSAEQGSGH